MRSPGRRSLAVAALALVDCFGCRSQRPPLHPENPPGAWYVLRPGETLGDVAKKTGTPLDDILELNGIARGESVEPGRLIFVLDASALHGPGDAGAGAATPRGSAGHKGPSGVPEPPGGPEPPRRAAIFRWPLGSPRVTSGFGVRGAGPHEGIDLGAPEETPVFAAGVGDVIYAGDGIKGYGNLVVIQHSDGLLTVYAHNAKLLVKVGDRVGAGQSIALVGQTGHATAPHLHFEVRDGQIPRDPMRYLPSLP